MFGFGFCFSKAEGEQGDQKCRQKRGVREVDRGNAPSHWHFKTR